MDLDPLNHGPASFDEIESTGEDCGRFSENDAIDDYDEETKLVEVDKERSSGFEDLIGYTQEEQDGQKKLSRSPHKSINNDSSE